MFYDEVDGLILYHGSKDGLKEITIQGSRVRCDFGQGFYLGESYQNALDFVSQYEKSSVYLFECYFDDLNVVEFNLDFEWMIAICYFRGTLNEYKNHPLVQKVLQTVLNADVIIAPIADNRMFEIMTRFANGEIEKHYIACCYGIPKKDATLNAYLFKDSKKAIVYISKEPKKGASKIQTSYKLLEENKDKNLSLLDVTLHTGKTHQIRAHLAYAGLPVLGDGKYGSYEINKRFKVYTQALCSYSITLPNGTEIKLKKIPFKEYLDD